MRARSFLTTVAAIGGLALAPGCGPDCQSTCNRLYQENECNLQRPGQSRDDLLRSCNNACTNALKTPGEIREEYTPSQYTPSDQSVRFINDQEAALWMDCVETQACEKLDDGYCSPTSSFGD
ncbi:MAG: hypothetical protein VX265_02370 [Myxococcota bacterium]|nr:hypothetical protein [Myxococcota bacterium]MEC8424322.1 hypothetical protein [Myxococcota bacterium]